MEDKVDFTLSFTCELDERAKWEIEQKGYFEHAVVHFADGSALPVSFWDPVRMSQDLETELSFGRKCIAEIGMIVVPQVTIKNMEAAIEELHRTGYFDRMRRAYPPIKNV